MQIIDAHIHFRADHPDAVKLVEELDLKILNMCVAGNNSTWRTREAEPYERLARELPGRFAWCTSFNFPEAGNEGDNADYVEHVIAGLEHDFAKGAIGCHETCL